MTNCEQHGFEHSERFPCDQYERYRQMTAKAHTLKEHETRPMENPDREGLLGMEQVEIATHESGWTGKSEQHPVNDDGWDRFR